MQRTCLNNVGSFCFREVLDGVVEVFARLRLDEGSTYLVREKCKFQRR